VAGPLKSSRPVGIIENELSLRVDLREVDDERRTTARRDVAERKVGERKSDNFGSPVRPDR
jgi:hypothetical protein